MTRYAALLAVLMVGVFVLRKILRFFEDDCTDMVETGSTNRDITYRWEPVYF